MGEYFVLEQLEKVLVLLVVILFGRLVRYLLVVMFDLMMDIMVVIELSARIQIGLI